MRPLRTVLVLLFAYGVTICDGKTIKIHGYVTSVASPTRFDIEDFKITRDQKLTLEFDKSDAEEQLDFRPEDIAVGTELQIKGEFDDQTGELQASEVKVFLRDNTKIHREALIDATAALESVANGRWNGIIRADGQRIRVDQNTEIRVRQNRSEKKLDSSSKKKPARDQSAEGEPERSNPLRGEEISPTFFITYDGYRQRDGTVLANKIVLKRGEVEPGEERLWKSVNPKVQASSYVGGKPGEIIIRGVGKYKLVPNEEAQAYVQQLGSSLIPSFQRSLPLGDQNKIPFQFYLSRDRRNAFNAFALPNGTVVIDSTMFNVLENEAQLVAVLSHEIAHATEKHQWRQRQFHKKKRVALQVATVAAAAYGKYNLRDSLQLVDAAIRNGYQRYLENQADRVGMSYMMTAGYDARQAPQVWKAMARNIGDQPTDFFWSNHDNHTTRRSYLMAELKNNYSEVKFDALRTDSEEFEKVKAIVATGLPTQKTIKIKIHSASAAGGGNVASAPPTTQQPIPVVSTPTFPAPKQASQEAVGLATVNGLTNVTFTSNPPGAVVSFSGMGVCHSPCVIKLEAKRYRVKMRLAGYDDWTGEITVEAGKPSTVAAQMESSQ